MLDTTKQLEDALKEMDTFNKHFYNHVSIHKEDALRKGITVIQIALLVGLLLIV